MRGRLLIVLATFGALGCGLDLLGPEFEQRLTHFGGCGDVRFFAVDAEDELMVSFGAQGLVAAARQAGGPETTALFDFPTNAATLVIEQGSRVSDAMCDDVIVGPGPRVRRTWTATSGSATVRIRPIEDALDGARGDLVLEDVVFTSDDGDEVVLDRLEWVDVSVGWLPG